jgi:hypothetical protein
MSEPMKTVSRMWLVLLVATTGALSVVGCGSEPETPPQPGPPDAGTPPPPPVPDAGVPQPTAVTPCDAVMSLAMSTALQGRAAGEAPGMQPDGASVCGVVGEGQSVQSETILLQQGRCYNVLAQGMPNVTEVDVQVEADLTAGGMVNPALSGFLKGPPLMIGTGAGVMDASGSKANCFSWTMPFPLAVKVSVKSRIGSGPVAAQLYSKKK